MAFGVKVKLDVEVIGGSKLNTEIQKAVDSAIRGKPITIRHLSIDLGRQEAQRISKQLESAIAARDISIKIAKIDASKPVADLKKQLTTMLSGLSITGLKEFLGTDGVAESYDKAAAAANKLVEAQNNVKKKTEETNAAMQTLKSVQSTLDAAFKGTTSVNDPAKLKEYLDTYHKLTSAIESAKNMQGTAQGEAVKDITATTIALKQQVDAQLEAEKAAKKEAEAAKKKAEAEELAERAAKERAEAAKQAEELAAQAAKKEAEAQEELRQRTEETNAALRELNAAQSMLNTIYKSSSEIGNQELLGDYLSRYREYIAAIESAKNMEGTARAEKVAEITEAVVALKREVEAELEAEKAIKKKAAATKSAEEAEKQSAAEKERAAKKEADLARQAIQLRQRINTWIQNNSKAYKLNRTEIDTLLSSLQSESSVTASSLAEIRRKFEEINASAHASGIAGKSFFDTLKAGWEKFGGWSLVTKSMMAAYNGVKQMISAVIELDAAMTELRKVTDLSEAAYSKFIDTAAQTSKRIGASLSDTINSTADFARLGYDLSESAMLAEAALVYKNVGDGIQDVSVATESLISTIKAFGYEANEAMFIVDKFNEVGNNFAISSSGIGDALKRSASSLAEAGNTLEESIALITAMNSVIQDPDSVGTALKTMTMYLRAAKTEAEAAGIETDGMAESVASLREKIGSLTGVDIMIDDRTFKSTYQIIKEIANVWDSLSDTSRSNVLNLLGGKRNANVIASLIKNFGDAEKALSTAMNSLGSATLENEKYLNSINGKISVMKASFEELSNSVIKSDLIKFFVDLTTVILNVATGLAKINMLLPTLTGAFAFFRGRSEIKNQFSEVQSIVQGVKSLLQKETPQVDDAFDLIEGKADGLSVAQRKLMLQLLESSNAFNKFSEAQRETIRTMTDFSGQTPKVTGSIKGIHASAKQAGIGLKEMWKSMSWLSKASAILTAVEVVFGIITNIINHINAQKEEARQRTNEAAAEAKETTESIIEASTKYQDLADALHHGTIAQDEFETSARDIIASLTEQGETVDGLIEKYGGLAEAIRGASNEALKEAELGLRGKVNQSYLDLSGAYSDSLLSGFQETSGDISTYFEKSADAYDALKALEDAGYISKGAYSVYDDYTTSGGFAIHLVSKEDIGTAEGAIKAYEELGEMLKVVSENSTTIGNPVYTALYKEYARLKPLVQGYYDDVLNLSRNIANQYINNTPSDIAGIDSQDDFDEYRENLIAACVEAGQFGEETEGVMAIVTNGVDSVLANTGWAKDYMADFTYIGNGWEQIAGSADTLTDALQNLKAHYSLLSKAQSEMNDGSGLSIDTINSMQEMLGDEENLLDYLSVENGLLVLNKKAWDDREEAMANGQIDAREDRIDYLKGLMSEYKGLDIDQIEDEGVRIDLLGAPEEIERLTFEIEAYEAVINRLHADNDPLNLETLITNLDTISGKANGLIPIFEQLKGGDMLSQEDLASLALKFPELLSVDGLFDAESAEEQLRLMQPILDEYEKAYDKVISDRIDLLKKAQDAENQKGADKDQAKIDSIQTVIAALEVLMGMNMADIYGTEKTEIAADRYKKLADAISDATDAANVLAAMKNGDNYLNTFQKIVNFVKEHDGFSLDDFINTDATFKDVTPELIDKVMDVMLEGMTEVEGWRPEFGEMIREQCGLIIDGADDAKTGLEGIADGMSAIKSAADMLSGMKAGDDYLGTMQEIIEFVRKHEGFSLDDFLNADGTFKDVDAKLSATVFEGLLTEIKDLDGYRFEFGEAMRKQFDKIIANGGNAQTALESFADGLDAIESTGNMLAGMKSGDDYIGTMQDIIDFLQENEGFSFDDFLNSDGTLRNVDDTLISRIFDSLLKKMELLDGYRPEFGEMLRKEFDAIAKGEAEAENAIDRLKNALNAVTSVGDFFTMIANDESSVIDQISAALDLAEAFPDEQGNAADWTQWIKAISADGSAITWNAEAIRALSDAQVDAAFSATDLARTHPELIQQIKDTAAAELEAATAAERISDAYEKVKSSVESLASVDGQTQVDYDTYNKLIEADKRYAGVIEYQNGVLTINADKYQEVTDAVIADTKAVTEQALAAELADERYLDLTSRIENLTDEEANELASINARIGGYRVLIRELENAQSAYSRFNNASASGDSDRYSTLEEMLQTIKDVTQNKDSDIYGMVGDSKFRIAYDFLISPNIEIDSDEYEKRLKIAERYITDGRKGIQNFVTDLDANGFISEDGTLNASLQQIADALNIDVGFLEGLFDQTNKYLSPENQIVIKPLVDTDDFETSVKSAIAKADEYLNTGANGIQKFYSDLANNGMFDEATRQITATPEQIAQALGISVKTAEQCVDRLKGSVDGISQVGDDVADKMTLEEAEKKLDSLTEGVKNLNSAKISFEYDENNIAEVEDILTRLVELAEKVNPVVLTFGNAEDSDDPSKHNALASKLDEIDKLQLTISTEEAVSALQGVIDLGSDIISKITSVGDNPMTISVDQAIASLKTVVDNVQTVINRINAIPSMKTTRVFVKQVRTGFNSGGIALAGGNANAETSAKVPGGRTLTGEEGREIVVDPHTNQWYTVGDHGAEFNNLPKDAIVFNAKQTKELLETGSTSSRGLSMASGNAAASFFKKIIKDVPGKKKSGSSTIVTAAKNLGSSLYKALPEHIKKTFDTVGKIAGGAVNGIVTGANNVLKTLGDWANGNLKEILDLPTSGGGGNGGGSGGSGSGGSDKEKSELEQLKEKYQEINEQLEHLIEHQEFLYTQADRGLDFPGMDASLQEQARIYKQMMDNSAKAVEEMRKKGADDTSKELQDMERAYWDAYKNMYGALDKIRDLYTDALNGKIDDIQKAFSNLSTAAKEFAENGGISVDTFQALTEHGLQYLSLLEDADGQYKINTEGINKIIAAEKEQLAIETALSYISSLKEALGDKEGNRVDALVDASQKISDSNWSAVYAQAALLKGLGLSDDKYQQVIQNIEALQTISNNVITDLSKGQDKVTDGYKDQEQALDKILEFTEDLIKAETEDRIEAIEDEISAYKEIIDLKKESLQTTKDENEYTKSVSEKVKEIADIQSRIDQLSLDDSREARAERAKLTEELSKLQEDLSDYQSDHAYDTQIDALDKMADDYEESRQPEIDALEESISSAEKVYRLAIERIRTGWASLYDDLIEWNTEQGSVLNQEITENWELALQAVQKYGDYLSAIENLRGLNTDVETPTIVASKLPKYHDGAIVGDAGSINSHEVLAVLEKGEIVLDEPKKRGLYKLIDFNQMLANKLGISIGTIGAPEPKISTLFERAAGTMKGGEANRISFNPTIRVEINHSGNMTDQDASRYGKQIANTTITELYDAFQRRGVGGVFSTKLKQ